MKNRAGDKQEARAQRSGVIFVLEVVVTSLKGIPEYRHHCFFALNRLGGDLHVTTPEPLTRVHDRYPPADQRARRPVPPCFRSEQDIVGILEKVEKTFLSAHIHQIESSEYHVRAPASRKRRQIKGCMRCQDCKRPWRWKLSGSGFSGWSDEQGDGFRPLCLY